MLSGLDAAERERVAALRGEGRFFWLDVSLSETSRDDLVDALGIPERALRALASSGDASASRTFHADRESVVFALRCYIESEAPAEEAAYRLRPVEVHVLVTGDYLLTLHEERISLPAVLAPELPEERSKPHVVYAVLEAMLATTSDALAEIERRLDAIGIAWAEEGGGRVPSRTTLRETGPRLATMRRRVSDEQAVFARIGVEIGALRGFDTRRRALLRPSVRAGRSLAGLDRCRPERDGDAAGSAAERACVCGERRGDDLRAAHIHHRILRHELRVDGRSGRHPDCLLAARVHRPPRGSPTLLALLGAPVSHR